MWKYMPTAWKERSKDYVEEKHLKTGFDAGWATGDTSDFKSD